MFGIGPMLPVIPAAEKRGRFSKLQKRKSKHSPSAESHELTITRRPSTAKTESTLFEDNNEYMVQESTPTPHHQRDLSLVVDFDLDHAAAQLNDGEISDLELALFAFWIKVKHENYLMAKELVRELALDQGYNIDKVVNPRVRKLLQEVHDVRPRSVPRRGSPSILAASDDSHRDQVENSAGIPKSVKTSRRVLFAAASESSKTWSNKFITRDPRHASTRGNPFQDQTGVRMRSGTRAVSSPLTARMDTLPPSLRLKRELVVQEAARSITMSNEVTDYPPNTPDRPAPLSVKSRGSQLSNSTTMPASILRSVSTPIRNPSKGDLAAEPSCINASKTRDTGALGFLSFTPAKGSSRSMGDVFGAAHDTFQNQHNSLADRLQSPEDRRYGIPGRYTYRDSSGHALGPYHLGTCDVASESSYGTFTSLQRKNKNRSSMNSSCNGGMIRDESFDALESYIGSEDEEQGSILESASNISEEEAPTQYQFAVKPPPSQPIIAGPVPRSSERYVAAEARRKTQVPNLSAQAANFHRPISLRIYESEATMFSTAGAQAHSGRNRSKSVTSIVASRRSTTETMAALHTTDLIPARNILDEIEREFYERNDSHTKISEQVDRDVASVSQRSSSASTLAAFPIPPMENPVGQLPMLVSRAVSSPQSLRSITSQHPVASASLEDTYRAIVRVAMDAVLQRTRDRGEGLQAVDWNNMTSFERAWREMNALLLVTIYGRTDVFLDETDITYVDRVAEVLRNEASAFKSMDWVRRMFEADA